MEKILLVTGGSRGIGAATVRLAAKRGYRIGFTYRQNQPAADALVGELTATGVRVVAMAADVGNEDDVIRVFARVDCELGPISALVNNAGILEQQMRVDQMDAARLYRVFATNVVGSFLCAREAVRRMSSQYGGKGGAIVNVSSGAAKVGAPQEYVDYAASKGAIDTFTVGLAKEVAMEGIRVNAVRPGAVYTDIHASGGEPGRVDRVKSAIPMQRGGQPEEIANAILWLLSEEASYITGTCLDVTGGR